MMGTKAIKYDPYHYQAKCLNIIIKELQSELRRILIQLPTGGGKTIIFAHLIKFLLEKNPNMRILVLAHRSKLIEQARKKLIDVWPEAKNKIGIFCASVSTKKEYQYPITIASVQSIHKRVPVLRPFHLAIIDEAHRIPASNMKGQYTDVIRNLESLTKYFKLLCFTATPWRLGHGYIFGDAKRPDRDNYFDKLSFSYTTHKLIKEGHLSKYRLFCAEKSSLKKELDGVKISKGEYNNAELTKIMIKKQHIESIVESINELAEDRKSIAVFCASIEHIKNVANYMDEVGFSYGVYHSKRTKEQNEQVLKDFESFKIRILLSIDKLTEGYDNDRIDCLVDASGTMSSAKWLQRLGRGFRWHKLKKDCIIIDLACNMDKHLSINDPKVVIPGIPEGDRPAPFKLCPKCKLSNVASALKCKDKKCGYVFPIELRQYSEVKLVEYISPKERKNANPSSTVIEPHGCLLFEYKSMNDNHILSLAIFNRDFGATPPSVTEFLDFSNTIPFLTDKSKRLWATLTGKTPPISNKNALARKTEFLTAIPKKIEVAQLKRKGNAKFAKHKRFWSVVCWGVSPWNE